MKIKDLEPAATIQTLTPEEADFVGGGVTLTYNIKPISPYIKYYPPGPVAPPINYFPPDPI